MIYYVRNKSGDLFKLDYPCFGMLSCLDDLSNSSWRNDLWCLNGIQWEIPREHRNSDWSSHSAVEGFDVDDLETIYLPTCGRDVNITHPFFNRLSKGELPDEISRVDQYAPQNRGCIVLTLEAGVPCDELFMPLFAVREIIENTMCSAVYDLVKEWGVPDDLAVFFGATFYKSRSWNFKEGNRVMEDTFYPQQEDGGTFSNGRVGDFISIMNGERPRYISSVWGSMSRGYPAYGVTEVNHDDDDDYDDDGALDHEDHDGVVGRIHHMNDSLVLQSYYDNSFANTHLTDSSFNRMAEQEFRSFVMEILQYVNYSNQSGT